MSRSRPNSFIFVLLAVASFSAGCQSISDFRLTRKIPGFLQFRKESESQDSQPRQLQQPVDANQSDLPLAARTNVAPPSKRPVSRGPKIESDGFVLKPAASSDVSESQSLDQQDFVLNLDALPENRSDTTQIDVSEVDDLEAEGGFELELLEDDQRPQSEDVVRTAEVSEVDLTSPSSKSGVILVAAETDEQVVEDLQPDVLVEFDEDESDEPALLIANALNGISLDNLDDDSLSVTASTKVSGSTKLAVGSREVEEDSVEKILAVPASIISSMPVERYPIDLPTVLRLAGADNWSIQLAYERILESDAQLESAQSLWMPSLTAGIGYTKHDGQLQATEGPVTGISRGSLFVGGGAGIGQSPLTGGAGGPARLFVDLSLADAIFEPLAARQLFNAAGARHSAVFNDTLASASLAYYSLVKAQGRLADAGENSKSAEELRLLTKAFVSAGKGSQADSARASAEATRRQQEVAQAKLAITVTSAQLARILQMDPRKLSPDSVLQAPETYSVPVELVDESSLLEDLIAQGQSMRPEVSQNQSEMEAARRRVQAERWRPWIPNVRVGASAGGFGGGVNDNIPKLDGRSDFDILAVWELKNLGFGTRAAQRAQKSRFRQTQLESLQLQDTIATEVISAYYEVKSQREQMALSKSSLKQARLSLERNIARIRGLEGLPLEAVQSLQALASARQRSLSAKIGYNQAQVRLLRAIGRPVDTEG